MTTDEDLNEVENLIAEYVGCKYAVVFFCVMSDSMNILSLISEHYRDVRYSAQI